jgi:hypothetical protein
MEEQEQVTLQMLERDRDDVPSARKSCMSMSHAPFGLQTSRR